jgi:hypothetical protein
MQAGLCRKLYLVGRKQPVVNIAPVSGQSHLENNKAVPYELGKPGPDFGNVSWRGDFPIGISNGSRTGFP